MSKFWGAVQVISHKPGDYNLHKRSSPSETWTKYYHLDRVFVSKYQWVHQGQQIGTMGSTGNASGPHLHFEIRENGRYNEPPINPEYYICDLIAPSKNSKRKNLATTWGSMKSKK